MPLTGKKMSQAAAQILNQTKSSFNKQIQDYQQTQYESNLKPGDDNANPYLNDLPKAEEVLQ